MATRGSVCTWSLWENSQRYASCNNVSFMQFSTKIDGFKQKRFTGLWELKQLLWTIPIREIFHFHHLPKLYCVGIINMLKICAIQCNLFIVRTLGPWKLLLYQGKKQRQRTGTNKITLLWEGFVISNLYIMRFYCITLVS